MDTLPSIFDEADTEAEERAWAEGEAEATAGQLIPHEEVVRWVKSWGTENELPMPKCPSE
jgi:predicted transcriptional regulator